MPFHEKSAWIMSCALLLPGGYYFYAVLSSSTEAGGLAAPNLPLLIVCAVILVAVAVIGHIAVAAQKPKEANTQLDERETTIVTRAGSISGYLVNTGIVLSLFQYLASGNGDVLFYGVIASLIVGQLADYLLQIIFHRTAL